MKEIDIEGELILESISEAPQFNKWMYNEIKCFSSGKILEIGSGIGNISKYFISNKYDLVMSDLRDQYVNNLTKKFPAQKIIKLDLIEKNFDQKYKDEFGKYDFVFALNVIEHIKNDKEAINNLSKFLKKGGKMLILVPAYDFLFNNFDKTLDHYRRYNKKKLNSLIPSNMKILKTWNFNFFGIFGWYVMGNLFRKKLIPKSNMKIYNYLVPIIKYLDIITFKKIGLSVINLSIKK